MRLYHSWKDLCGVEGGGTNTAADCEGRLIIGQKKSQDDVETFHYGQSGMTKLLKGTTCVYLMEKLSILLALCKIWYANHVCGDFTAFPNRDYQTMLSREDNAMVSGRWF